MFAQSPLRLLSRKVSNLGPIVLCIAAVVLCRAQTNTVDIYPGDDIPTIVQNNPAGTTFVIYPGLYRLSTPINAQDGDSFIGQTACSPPTTSCPAILSGGELLTSFQNNGSYYYVTGQTQQGQVTIASTHCEPDLPGYTTAYPGCIYPEDLFFDGVPLVHVTALTDVVSGTWYFDYTNHIIYFYDNPSGHTVETSVVPSAFAVGPANNVTIQNLTVKEFAAPILKGAIDGCPTSGCTTTGTGWIVKNNEITLNHGDGVTLSLGWQVLYNYIHTNGNRGIGGGAPQSSTFAGPLIQGNELAFNNYAHVAPHFGAGGAKLSATYNALFQGNYSHDNEGSGFHMDSSSYYTVFDGNVSADNTEQGIFHEISFNGVFRNNQLLRNGYIYPNKLKWMYGAGLLSSTSQNDLAYCNTVEVSGEGGNGINIIGQPHPTGTTYVSKNNYFHDNTVVFDSDASGVTGGARGSGTDPCCVNFFTKNNFDYNNYHFPNLTNHWFAWSDKYNPWTTFQTDGQEAHGASDTNNVIADVPTVTITSPPNKTSVSGTVNVQGAAQAVKGLSQVDLYVDWQLVQTGGKTSPFTFAWNTSGVTAGQHTVAVKVYDTGGLSSCYAEWLTVQ
jgi:parallel beta-helix repeat protein